MQILAIFSLVALVVQSATGQANAPERKEVRDMTDREWQDFASGVRALINDGTWVRLAQMHNNLFSSGIHGVPQFLPWHRQYLRDVEDNMRRYVPTAFVPYWDWTLDAGAPGLSPVFSANRAGTFPTSNNNRCLSSGWFQGFQPCIQRNVGGYTVRGWDAADVANALAGARGPAGYELMRSRLEGLHNMVHVGVGGYMNSAWSPWDPIFYMHHAMIDKIWADWQAQAPENMQAYAARTAAGTAEPLLGYPGVRVLDTFFYANYRQPSASGLRGEPMSVSSTDEMGRTAKRLQTLTSEQLAQIPRTCPAPERPSEEERGVFWSPETEAAIAFSEQRQNLELEGAESTCINLEAAQQVFDAAVGASAPDQEVTTVVAPEPVVAGSKGLTSLQAGLASGAAALVLVAVAAAVVVIKRRRTQQGTEPQNGSVVGMPASRAVVVEATSQQG